MSKLDTQTAYEKMRAYFSRPGAVIAREPDEYDDGTTCVYRGTTPEGRVMKCAVGCLVPKRLYEEHLQQHEGQGAQVLPFAELGLDAVDSDFLKEAQTYHDDAATPKRFVKELDKLAKGFGLKKPRKVVA